MANLLGGAQAFVGLSRRHANVDHRDVGVVAAYLQDRLFGVTGLADHLVTSLVEEMGHPFSQKDRVLGYHDAHALTALESNLRQPAGQSLA